MKGGDGEIRVAWFDAMVWGGEGCKGHKEQVGWLSLIEMAQ